MLSWSMEVSQRCQLWRRRRRRRGRDNDAVVNMSKGMLYDKFYIIFSKENVQSDPDEQ